jgi:hypothetical protein
VEDHVLPTTGAPQIATVVYGQSNVLYAIRPAMQHSTRPDVRALVLIAVTICAVRDGTLQVLVHVATNDLFQ